MSNRRDYNDIPKKTLDYSTDRSVNTKSGFGKLVEDFSAGVVKDIVQPTIRNLLSQSVDLMSSTIKSAIVRKTGGYPTNYSQGYPYSSGYSGNAMYNPNDFRNRFNTADGYPATQPLGVGNSPSMREPWKNVGFRTELDADQKKFLIKKRLAEQNYISVYQFGQICEQEWDFTLDNYGWTSGMLDSMRIRYNIVGGNLPFEFADIPEPVYLNKTVR